MTAEKVVKDCCKKFLKQNSLLAIDIDSFNFEDLLLNTYRIIFRLVPPIQYKVHLSEELKKQLREDLKETEKEGVELVIKELSEGKDVSHRLSKQVWNPKPFYTDHLLSEWNIYHLHLGLRREENSFLVERTEKLVYMLINKDSVFLIKCLPHKFEYLELVRIIEKNWPELLANRKLPNNVMDLVYIPKEEDIKKARRKKINSNTRANINLTIKGNNGFYMPNLGVATDGTPFIVSLSVIDTIKIINKIDKEGFKFKKADIVFLLNIYKYGLKLHLRNSEDFIYIPLRFPITLSERL